LLLSPPTVSLLNALRGGPIDDLPEHLRPLLAVLEAGVIPPIWVGPGVRMLPLFSQGLPPSSYTNAFAIGTEFPYLIDPGASDADEQQRLFVALDDTLAGRRLAGVVLTHYHPDHVGAATVCAERYSAPVLAHAEAARLLNGKVRVDRYLVDGDRLDLGPAPDGKGRWHLEAVHTPGHAPDHLCFWEPKYRYLFVGDMISTLSSVVIAPPEGDLSHYLDSLRRLQRYPARLLFPAHGSPSARPAFLLEEGLAHRAKREAQLLEALAVGPRGLAEMSLEIYRGLPPVLMKFGELQLLAGLQKLQREGRAVEEGPVWKLAPPTSRDRQGAVRDPSAGRAGSA
jgi:ribonuclease/clavin/mitogillin